MSTTEATSSQHEIHIAHVLRAPRRRVYEAWLQPDQILQWRGPTGWQILEAESEPTVGGKHRVVVRGTLPASPGQQPEEVTGASWGVYTDLIPNEFIRFTWLAVWAPGEDSAVTIRLSDVEAGTLLDLTHDRFQTPESAQAHKEAWDQALGRLADYLEAF